MFQRHAFPPLTADPRHAAARRGALSHHKGAAAEEVAARAYLAEGARLRETRWRAPEGEIDLILETEDGLVFVEVKARKADAAASVSARQWARIGAAATRYMAERMGAEVACRFDLALVDGVGRVERIENARSFEGW